MNKILKSSKFKVFCLGLLFVFALLTLSACGDPKHTHTYAENWEVEKAATIFEDGILSRTCTDENCPDQNKGKETKPITALGKTNEVYDAFTSYADNLEKLENGVKLGQIVDSNDNSAYGAAISFALANGDLDGIYELETGITTIGFTLDLTSFAENDFTVFSMNYVQKIDTDPGRAYVTENMFGVLKTANGYTIAQINNTTFGNGDRDLILASSNKVEIEDADNILTFGYKLNYNPQNNYETQLGTKLVVNGEEKITFTMNYNPVNTEAGISRIDGIGTLWNVTSNKDTAVFSNLVKE